MDNEKKVLDAFKKAGKPLSAKEAAELAGVEKKDVDKIIKQLKADDKLDSPKRCYYQIK